MTAPAPNLVPALPQQPFDAASDGVNAWRGRCLDAFARAEAAITECLVSLSEPEKSGKAVRMPHLVGQRMEALSHALAAIGTPGPDVLHAQTALAALRDHDGLRTMLCHGVGNITLDRNGRWTVVLRLTALRARRVVRDMLTLTEQEAADRRDDLVKASKILCARLGQVRAKAS
ncbi:MAG: hypothetical protein JWR80_6715 [Bradyrhizobium sp.]|nr:hypothetical protein [Bradyrhizobium sp.]